jgi:hypothetical protein
MMGTGADDELALGRPTLLAAVTMNRQHFSTLM